MTRLNHRSFLVVLALALCSVIHATVVVTNPTNSSVWAQGSTQVITWTSNGTEPPNMAVYLDPQGNQNVCVVSQTTPTSNNQLSIVLNDTCFTLGPWILSMSSVTTGSGTVPFRSSPVFQVVPSGFTTSTSTPQSTKSHSSTGAIAGGVIGGAIGGLGIIAGLVMLFQRRRRRSTPMVDSDKDQGAIAATTVPHAEPAWGDASGVTLPPPPMSPSESTRSQSQMASPEQESRRLYNYDDPSTWPPSLDDIQGHQV